MDSTRPLVSKFSSPFNNPSVTVPRTPITIGIYATFMFDSFSVFFNSLPWSRYLSFFSFFFNFSLWSAETANSIILQVLVFYLFFFFLITITRSGLLTEIRWSVCMSKSHRSLCVSFSRTDAGLCIYHLFFWSNFNFLHNSQWMTYPTRSYLALYSYFCPIADALIICCTMWNRVCFIGVIVVCKSN